MKGHYNVLTQDQLYFFNQRFVFKQVDDGILVSTTGYNRTVFHGFSESFQAIGKIGDRKITFKITPKAIELWRNPEIAKNNSLIDIQNTINKIIVSSQQITDQDILANLKQ